MSWPRNNCSRGRFLDHWPRFDNNSTYRPIIINHYSIPYTWRLKQNLIPKRSENTKRHLQSVWILDTKSHPLSEHHIALLTPYEKYPLNWAGVRALPEQWTIRSEWRLLIRLHLIPKLRVHYFFIPVCMYIDSTLRTTAMLNMFIAWCSDTQKITQSFGNWICTRLQEKMLSKYTVWPHKTTLKI
jgi:hypothetical protein